eukprot:3686945-Pyramimonas_sp.AAC.1
MQQWQGTSRSLLRRTLPARDIDDKCLQAIVEADNGNWDDEKSYHSCVIGDGACPLGCNGDEATSLRKVTEHILIGL